MQNDFKVTNASICTVHRDRETYLDFPNSSQSVSTLANPHMDSQTEPWMALSLNLHPRYLYNLIRGVYRIFAKGCNFDIKGGGVKISTSHIFSSEFDHLIANLVLQGEHSAIK